ncbi:MAG: hypothetical protein Q8R13_05165 [bacterium]|nr:hypothetical protein [bacterium]MDZ4295797.1 hypothetical protein [Patescibacteria group bacterium]
MKNFPLLFVSKDLGGAGVGVPLARAARAAGYDVTIVSEGLASAVYEAAGFSPFLRGAVDAENEPGTIDAAAVLEQIHPAAVLVTCSNPIHWEEHFALAANQLGIPLVIVEDFWGGSFQITAAAQLIITLDDIGAAAIRAFRPHVPVVIAGNHAVNEAQVLTRSTALKQKRALLKEKFGTLLFFVGGGPDYTGVTLKLLKGCLERTAIPWGLMVSFHPKWRDIIAPDGRRWREVWKEELRDLNDRIITLDEESDDICALSDVTLSAFSTMLTKAVVLGRSAISLMTPEGARDLKARTTFTHHPLVETGLVHEISAPRDLAPYLTAPAPDAQKISTLLKPYDAPAALTVIEARIRAHDKQKSPK